MFDQRFDAADLAGLSLAVRGVAFHATSSRERLLVDVRGLPRGTPAALSIDDGTGTMVEVAGVSSSGGGRARFRLDTRRGRVLPLRVETVRDLADRAFLVTADGSVVLTGTLPRL